MEQVEWWENTRSGICSGIEVREEVVCGFDSFNRVININGGVGFLLLGHKWYWA